MPSVNMLWTYLSKPQFEEVRLRANASDQFARFAGVHKFVMSALLDLDQAMEKGEPKFNTRRPGGQVRHWIHKFLSINYAIFEKERVGWILNYKTLPATWPF